MSFETNYIEALRNCRSEREKTDSLIRDIQNIVFGDWYREEPGPEVIDEVLRWEMEKDQGD